MERLKESIAAMRAQNTAESVALAQVFEDVLFFHTPEEIFKMASNALGWCLVLEQAAEADRIRAESEQNT
jgi:hypothetical protein